MVRLEIQDEAGEVVNAYNLDVSPGAQVLISGFHGTASYEVTEFDRVLTVKFTGVTSVEDAPKELKPDPQTTEDGVKESDAEALNRQMAEEDAKKNDAKKAKDKPKAEKPVPEPAKAASKS